MNPQDSENIVKDDEHDDLGIYVFDDSECIEIQQVVRICKYVIAFAIISAICGIIYTFAHLNRRFIYRNPAELDC